MPKVPVRLESLTYGLVLAALLALAGTAAADPPKENARDPNRADTSRAARENAIESIPFEKLSPEARAKAAAVLSKISVFRRMPIRVIRCDPEMYLFLVEHPDITVNVWQVLGISQMSIDEKGPGTYEFSDAAGTTAHAYYLFARHDLHVIYTEAVYEGPLFAKPIHSKTLLVLKSGYVQETDGQYYITCRLDAFIQVDENGAELLTKAFHPLMGNVADTNFTQTAGFLASLSHTAEVNPQGVERLAGKLSKVAPEVRSEFARLAQRVAEKAVAAGRPPQAAPPVVAEQPGSPPRR